MEDLLKIASQLPYQQDFARIYQLQQKERRLKKNRSEKVRARANRDATRLLPQQ
jgi:hypothetical protein